MLTKAREKLSYANVVATIALIFAVGGGTFAVAALKRNSVDSKQIAPKAVRGSELASRAVSTKKLADGAVSTPKILDGALTTAKLADNAVTGAKADESTFGQVPSAAMADDATTVGGQSPAQLRTVSAFDENQADVAIGALTTVASATVTTPSAGAIVASASVELVSDGGDNDIGVCRIAIDGVNSTDYRTDVGAGATNASVVAVQFSRTLAAGAHTAAVLCLAAGGVTKDDAAISVLGIPS